jgi:hypothetical protein
MIFVQKDPHPEDRGNSEGPQSSSADTARLPTNELLADDDSALADEMRLACRRYTCITAIAGLLSLFAKGLFPSGGAQT